MIIFKRYDYLGRGLYYSLINEWRKYYSSEKIFLLKLEDLEKDPQKELNLLFKFLELNEHIIPNLKKQNIGNYEKISEDERKFLENFFDSDLYNLKKKFGIVFE